MKRLLSYLLAPLLLASPAQAAEVSVAVAANFTAPMQKIAAAFEQDTGHRAVLAFGSTGKFHTQIRNGAPFQLLLAADGATPQHMESEGLTVAGTRFTYATGKLVLWSRQPGLVDGRGEVLMHGRFDHIALADPKQAPYGAAAIETLQKLGVFEQTRSKFVVGMNIAQTYQFVATESAALGFVALSQVFTDGRITQGSAWIVPANLHAPIRQDAVVLSAGKDHAATAALVRYLRGDTARGIIRAFGYDI